MTVLGFCPPDDERNLAPIVGGAENVFTDVNRFESALRHTTAPGIVVVLPVLTVAPGIEWVRRLRRRHVLHPLILVTRKDPENVQNLTNLAVDRIVWYRGYASELPDVLRRVLSGTLRNRLADWLSGLRNFPRPVRDMLLAAVEADPLCREVAEWARFLHMGESTLRRLFEHELGEHGLHPKAWIDGVRLLSALEAIPLPRSYAALARHMGSDPRTVERMVLEIMGTQCAPRDLTAIGVATRLMDHVQAATHSRGGSTWDL